MFGGRRPAEDEVGDALGLGEVRALARRLERRHQRLCQMHIGILAAIGRDRRPVFCEFLGARAVARLPEAPLQDVADVGEQPVRLRMADDFRARSGEQHEAMAIRELLALARAVVIEGPEIAAVLRVAMALEDGLHPVVDEIARARPPEEMADREAMDHARRRMQRAHAIGLDRMSRVVERMEAAGGIDRFVLEEAEEAIGLSLQPAPMVGVLAPRRRIGRQIVHS